MSDLQDSHARAARALIASGYDSGDNLVDIYDLVCDLLHLADEYGPIEEAAGYRRDEGDTATWGEHAAQMGLRHYHTELAEEAS